MLITWSNFTWPNQLIKTFINVILSYFKVSINWPIFRRLTEKFDQLIRSSEIRSTDPLSCNSKEYMQIIFTFLWTIIFFLVVPTYNLLICYYDQSVECHIKYANVCNFNVNFIFKLSYNGKRSLGQISVDRNCVLSLDRNYVNHLIEFHLIESVDWNFKKPKIPLLELSINCQKRTYGFWHLIESLK